METNPLENFFGLPDPRSDRNQHHPLSSIVFLTISAVICGADNWVEVSRFGEYKLEWLQQYISLPYGIPSHDTIGRFYAALTPEQFEECFIRWVDFSSVKTNGEVIAIDGKTVRGSYDRASDKSAIHLVSAWANSSGIVIGQVKTNQKSNEITAIPALLQLLMVEGCIITIDAMGCQKDIVKEIRDQKADYLIAVKTNQPTLHEQIIRSFNVLTPDGVDIENTADHGRIETRKCEVIRDLKWIEVKDQWKDLQAIVRITSQRTQKSTGETTEQTRFYITSLKEEASSINHAVRAHWSIENNLHWCLDMIFNEDYARNRMGASDRNLSTLRKIALNMIKSEKSTKSSLAVKRKQAAWNNMYLQKVLKV